jgi:hypothetical protein
MRKITFVRKDAYSLCPCYSNLGGHPSLNSLLVTSDCGDGEDEHVRLDLKTSTRELTITACRQHMENIDK